ncbi:MAG: YeeE/YedE family protein [Deltaproteobacteria bacterium]|nr:YeeE/YedE family protein [Deltaproteobacteria bacterium]
MNVQGFTPLPALLGGALLGLSASWLLAANGRVAGISGIVAGALPGSGGAPRAWRGAFLAGLVLMAAALAALSPALFATPEGRPWWLLGLSGLLTGFGTRLGGGCTSGHGVCGLSRRSPRSLAATGTFMALGFLTVYLARHVLGGAS